MYLRRTFPVQATLTRMALAIAFCWLFAFAGAAPASAQITINIFNPSADFPEDDPLGISVTVTSPSEVTSVQAAVGTRTSTLTHPFGTWSGTLSLAGTSERTASDRHHRHERRLADGAGDTHVHL
jgi:hypothetical protein